MVSDETKLKIQDITNSEKIVLFIKGDVETGRMCGFSRRIVQIFDEMKEKYSVNYVTYNVWADEEVYLGLKEVNDWPTYPQIFIDSEFVGGCDIVSEIFEDGELDSLVKDLK